MPILSVPDETAMNSVGDLSMFISDQLGDVIIIFILAGWRASCADLL